MRQSISSCISLALAIIDLKVIPENLLYPVDLPRAQAFGIDKPAEIVMIGKDKYFKFAAL